MDDKIIEPVVNRKFNFGDILHVLEIAVLLISIGIYWQRLELTMDREVEHGIKLDRIEHYLSSRDANYWKLSKENQ
jgi:hypothetical protein